MIVDAHQHFWDPAIEDSSWPEDADLAPVRRPFAP